MATAEANVKTEKKTAKKKKKRKLTPVSHLLCVIALAVSGYFLFTVGKEVMTVIQLQREVAEVQAKLQEVTDENEYLNAEKTKLQDPDYVGSYARGKYMISKQGEQIFVLPSDDDTDD